jgi:hypothetical protein
MFNRARMWKEKQECIVLLKQLKQQYHAKAARKVER